MNYHDNDLKNNNGAKYYDLKRAGEDPTRWNVLVVNLVQKPTLRQSKGNAYYILTKQN